MSGGTADRQLSTGTGMQLEGMRRALPTASWVCERLTYGYLKVSVCLNVFLYKTYFYFTSPPKCVCAERLCSDCGKGWLRFENTCYFLSQNRLTWQQSRQECQRKGGDLAVITNERVQVSKFINTVKWKLREVIYILMYSCFSTISHFCRCIWVRKGLWTTGLG